MIWQMSLAAKKLLQISVVFGPSDLLLFKPIYSLAVICPAGTVLDVILLFIYQMCTHS